MARCTLHSHSTDGLNALGQGVAEDFKEKQKICPRSQRDTESQGTASSQVPGVFAELWELLHNLTSKDITFSQAMYFDLLSKLPEDLKNFRPAKKILVKLQKFGENLDLRIRPHVLLKVLQDLRIWELCSPDIAVAIENF
ncbi:hypothetical protein P7K49_020398 [Saguinus oedipus]|uniref:Uncharacterized protein n=1 Tax=Saguinus oedipus TaxID=9490 RepID=A0ABQ9V053_SAGOE|nr:hypothetical protein P7K49_020398 [Saguinus oedipus]